MKYPILIYITKYQSFKNHLQIKDLILINLNDSNALKGRMNQHVI